MNTGLAPLYDTAFTVAMKVSVGTMTSSPCPTFARRRLNCRAEVPFTQAIAYLAPV